MENVWEIRPEKYILKLVSFANVLVRYHQLFSDRFFDRLFWNANGKPLLRAVIVVFGCFRCNRRERKRVLFRDRRPTKSCFTLCDDRSTTEKYCLSSSPGKNSITIRTHKAEISLSSWYGRRKTRHVHTSLNDARRPAVTTALMVLLLLRKRRRRSRRRRGGRVKEVNSKRPIR